MEGIQEPLKNMILVLSSDKILVENAEPESIWQKSKQCVDTLFPGLWQEMFPPLPETKE